MKKILIKNGYVVTVNAATAAGTTIVNSADVTSQTTDPVSSNNTTSTSVLVEITGDSDLAVSMTAAPTPVFVATALTYTIQVTNLGLASAAGVTVVDTLPATLLSASATTSQGSCGAVTGGTITCTLGAVAYPLATGRSTQSSSFRLKVNIASLNGDSGSGVPP